MSHDLWVSHLYKELEGISRYVDCHLENDRCMFSLRECFLFFHLVDPVIITPHANSFVLTMSVLNHESVSVCFSSFQSNHLLSLQKHKDTVCPAFPVACPNHCSFSSILRSEVGLECIEHYFWFTNVCVLLLNAWTVTFTVKLADHLGCIYELNVSPIAVQSSAWLSKGPSDLLLYSLRMLL